MFVRIFQYRVLPQLRDRHLAVQQRASRLYGKHTSRPPQYLRRSNDPHVWVELHWYPDRDTCRQVADAVGRDNELMKLWHEFQETLDPAFPVVLEEFDEYEVPAPPSTAPWAQPPIDDRPVAAPMPRVVSAGPHVSETPSPSRVTEAPTMARPVESPPVAIAPASEIAPPPSPAAEALPAVEGESPPAAAPPPAITLPPSPAPTAPSAPPSSRWTMVAPSVPPVGFDSRQTAVPSRDDVMEVVDDRTQERGS